MRRLSIYIYFSILSSSFISCNGQVNHKKQSAISEEVAEVNKIPIPENGFSSGYVDKDGTLWFSSNGGGIFQYNGIPMKNYTEENGLSSNQVFSIALDLKDNLWFVF